MMDQLVAEFPAQILKAIKIGEAAEINAAQNPIHKIFVAGMGGSGIGANFVAQFVSKECKVPYTIGKDYEVPAYIDAHTLVICSSYSGNTEETVACFDAIVGSGAKIVVICSGGKLRDRAVEHDLDFIQLPAGAPSPRACLGYSLVQQLYILKKLDLVGNTQIGALKGAVELIEQERSAIKDAAKELASKIYNKLPIVYSSTAMEPVAVRFRQQINENGKMLCWHHVLPEMNHNELVGWRESNPNLAVIFLRNENDPKRTKIRTDITRGIVSGYTDNVFEVHAMGSNLIEKSLYLVHFVDWVSVYLADNRSMDAVEIKVIDYLKDELSKV